MTKNLEMFKERYTSERRMAVKAKSHVSSHMEIYHNGKCDGILGSALLVLSYKEGQLFLRYLDELDAKEI